MRTAAIALGFLGALAAASDVHDLKKDTFEPFVKDHDLVLAECESMIRLVHLYMSKSLTVVYSLRTMVRSLQGARS